MLRDKIAGYDLDWKWKIYEPPPRASRGEMISWVEQSGWSDVHIFLTSDRQCEVVLREKNGKWVEDNVVRYRFNANHRLPHQKIEPRLGRYTEVVAYVTPMHIKDAKVCKFTKCPVTLAIMDAVDGRDVVLSGLIGCGRITFENNTMYSFKLDVYTVWFLNAHRDGIKVVDDHPSFNAKLTNWESIKGERYDT